MVQYLYLLHCISKVSRLTSFWSRADKLSLTWSQTSKTGFLDIKTPTVDPAFFPHMIFRQPEILGHYFDIMNGLKVSIWYSWQWTFQSLSIGRVYIQFKGCLMCFFICISFLIEIPVSKQRIPWPDAAFGGGLHKNGTLGMNRLIYCLSELR